MYVATDTESTGLLWAGTPEDWGWYPARPFAFSFCDEKGNTDYVRWEVDPRTRKVLVPPKSHGDWRVIRDVLEDSRYIKVFHNQTHDERMYNLIGVKIEGRTEDSMTAMHIATGGAELSYALKYLAEKHLAFSTDDEQHLKELVQKWRRVGKKDRGWLIAEGDHYGKETWKADMWLPVKQVRKACKRYCIKDSQRTMLLWLLAKDTIYDDPGLYATYHREMTLQPFILRSENRGVRCFPENITFLREHYTRLGDRYKEKIEAELWEGFNVRSPKQMCKVFYEDRRHAVQHWTKNGNPSINQEALDDIATAGDLIARTIINYKACLNGLSMFLNPYDRYRHIDSNGEWIIHTSIRQVGPVTGRMASSDPNLMNVGSKETSLSRGVVKVDSRSCFGPREGYVWYIPDFSQIEVWLFAFASEDPTMCNALLAGEDFHSFISNLVFGYRPDFKRHEEHYRKRSKNVRFAKIYGGGYKALMKQLRCSESDAREFLRDDNSRLPGVNRYMNRVIARVRREGYTRNKLGRRYDVPSSLAYKATNYEVQGTAADIFKEAIIDTQTMLDEHWSGTQILLYLHDELVIEVPLEFHSRRLMMDIVKSMSESASKKAGLPVSLPVQMCVANLRWNRKKKVELAA